MFLNKKSAKEAQITKCTRLTAYSSKDICPISNQNSPVTLNPIPPIIMDC
jgi:hypothetical protein